MSKIDLSKANVGDKFRLKDRFAKYYNKLGREKFMQILEQNNHADKGFVMQVMKDSLNAMKTIKRARKIQDNQLQTHLEL